MALRYYRNGPARSLSSPIALASDTTMTVDNASGFPTQFPYTLIVEPNTALEEVVDVTAAVGNVLTIVRGVDSTTASAHASGSAVWHGVSARDPREANAHVNATTGVHGGVGSVVDTDSAQTIIGAKNFTGGLTTPNGAVVTVAGTQTVTGAKTFDTLSTTAGGAVVGTGDVQTITGAKTYSGNLTFNGNNTTAGTEQHNGANTFASTVTLGTEPLTGAWSTYAVERHNGGGGSVLNPGNGTQTGRYKKIGDKTVMFRVTLSFGSTSNIGTTDYIFTLPFAPADIRESGTVILFHSAVHTARTWHGIGGLEIALIDQAGARVGSTVPFAFGTGDIISISGTYEAA